MESQTTSRQHRADVVVVAVLVGVFVIGLTAYGVLGGYLNRVDAAVASMGRIEAVGAYEGRPAAVPDEGGTPDNFAVFAVNADGTLQAALVLHLDASRQNLTIIGVPSDTSLADPDDMIDTDGASLSSAFTAGPSTATKGLEQLIGVPMNHQFVLKLPGCRSVVDTVDGMNAKQVEQYLTGAPTPSIGAERLSTVSAIMFSTFTLVGSITDPSQSEQTLDALTPCVMVDASLTDEEVQSTLVSLKVRSHEIGTALLATPLSTVTTPKASALQRGASAEEQTADRGSGTPTVTADVLGDALRRDDLMSIPLAHPASLPR